MVPSEKFPGGTRITVPADSESLSVTSSGKKILVDWGFDELKRWPGHERRSCLLQPGSPSRATGESVEALPDFFRAIYETAQSVKPGALVEFCLGHSYSFFTMPHFDMSVASDPESSFRSFQRKNIESPDGNKFRFSEITSN